MEYFCAMTKNNQSTLLVLIAAGLVAPTIMVLVAKLAFAGTVTGYAAGLGLGVAAAVVGTLAMLRFSKLSR